MQPPILTREAYSDNGVCRIGHDISMREHYTFGTPGCTSSIKKAYKVVVFHLLVNTLLHMRAFAGDIIIVNHAFRCFITAINDTLDGRKRISTGGVGSKRFVHNKHLRLAIIENEDNLWSCQANIERNNHCSHARA